MDIRTSPRRWWALFSLVPASVAVGLDATVLSVALPTLGRELDATTNQLQWFLVAYTLAFAAAMIPAGNLGDRVGRKRVLLAALAVFGIASATCAVATGPTWFIAARVLLGIGAAAVLPMALAAIPFLFDEEERGRAVGLLMTVSMLGFPLGPLLGGWLLAHAWWGWVFLVNIPVVAIGLVAIAVLMPEPPRSPAGRVDVPGVVLSAAGLAALSYGLVEAGDRGWTDARSVLLLVLGVLVLAAFLRWERRTPDPLVDLRLFSSRSFSSGSAAAVLGSFVMMGLLFALPLDARAVHGLDAQGTGLRLLPLIGGMLLTAMPSSLLVRRVGPRVVIGSGMLVLAAGLAWGASTGLTTNTWDTLAWTLVCGAGLGMTLPTSMDAALGALPEEATGTGSAVLQALRMVGSSFGGAALGAVLNSGYRGSLDDTGVLRGGLPPAVTDAARAGVLQAAAVADRLGLTTLADAARSAYVSGMSQMLWAAFALTLAGGAVVTLATAGRRRTQPLDDRARAHTAGSEHERDSVA